MPDNGFTGRFNGHLRDELLNETLFTSLAQARVATALWRSTTTPRGRIPKSSGRHRPSSPPPSICGGRSPCGCAKGSAPAPVASPAQQGTTHTGNELKNRIETGGNVINPAGRPGAHRARSLEVRWILGSG